MRAVTLAPGKAGSQRLDEVPEPPEKPGSILVRALAKAWEQIGRIGRRARWAPERVVITGAGPVGLMAALMGVQRGLEVHVMDRNESGPKPALVRELGATYHREFPAIEPDIVIESTGSPAVIVQAASGRAARHILRPTRPGGGPHHASFYIATR